VDLGTAHFKVFVWHPLYNVFSMMALSYVSALTHSLLNVGKRVMSILVVILWFWEPFAHSTAFYLLLTLMGGLWYSVEQSKKKVVTSQRYLHTSRFQHLA
jgi:hypothetical protein